MTAISIAEEKLTVMEAEESDNQLKEITVPEIEEIPGQLTIWDTLPKDALSPVQTVELNQAA